LLKEYKQKVEVLSSQLLQHKDRWEKSFLELEAENNRLRLEKVEWSQEKSEMETLFKINEKKWTEGEKRVNFLENECNRLLEELETQKGNMAFSITESSEKEKEIKTLRDENEEMRMANEKLTFDRDNMRTELSNLQETLKEKEGYITEKELEAAKLSKEIEMLKKDLRASEVRSREKDRLIYFLKSKWGLPREKDVREEFFKEGSAGEEDKKGIRDILLVEANKVVREYLKEVLEGFGYHILEAKDGVQAMEMAHKHAPDLIVTETNLPGMNGIDLVKRLRKEAPTSKIPVLVATSKSEEQLKHDFGSTLRADSFLIKPFQIKKLVEKICGLDSRH